MAMPCFHPSARADYYVGDFADLVAFGDYAQMPGLNPLATRSCGVSVPQAALPDVAQPGALAFVLVTTVEDGVEGTLGSDSADRERFSVYTCP